MKEFLIILFLISTIASKASDLEISKPILYVENDLTYTTFNLSWNSAWHNDNNHDGVWLFFKSLSTEGGYKHIQIRSEGHTVISNFSEGEDDLSLGFEVPPDAVGLFLFPQNRYRGDIEATIKVVLDPKSFESIDTRASLFTAFGIEMVKIPAGGYVLGDADEKALAYGSFYIPDENGDYNGLVTVNTEDQQLEVSKGGDIYYQTNEGYEGDQKGIIPPSYPKGVESFYTMKYEITEGQYVGFLNSLSSGHVSARIIHLEQDYLSKGGTINKDDGKYFSEYPDKPCLFMSWDDAVAYADWAGLRPMTEFEFTKAARGTGKPKKNEFPWGSNSKEQIQRLPDKNGRLVMLNGWDESRLDDNTKKYFGASYYWVMDLAGSLWERVITIGHEKGRKFIGSHGDGILSSKGNATDENWPIGTEDSGGIGFRGGGFYGYDREYHEFNPFSPISYRPYGGWHGGMRINAYGTRLVRSGK